MAIAMVMAAVRQHHPAWVLLGVGSRWSVSADLCRRLKTEAGQPPHVGLVDAKGRIQHPQEVAQTCLADGIFQGEVVPGTIASFVRDLSSPSPVFVGEPSRRGRLSRWFGR